jgi:hypothetical protein
MGWQFDEKIGDVVFVLFKAKLNKITFGSVDVAFYLIAGSLFSVLGTSSLSS